MQHEIMESHQPALPPERRAGAERCWRFFRTFQGMDHCGLIIGIDRQSYRERRQRENGAILLIQPTWLKRMVVID